MGTQVRDAIVDFLEKNEGKYFTRNEIAEQAKTAAWSTGGVLHRLRQLGVLTRQKRGETNAYEYAAGKRMAFAKKHNGHRFPYHQPNRSKKIAVNEVETLLSEAAQAGTPPVVNVSDGISLIIKLSGSHHAVTLTEAHNLWQSLNILFKR